MNINTKFNVNQSVWFMCDNHIANSSVMEIKVKVSYDEDRICNVAQIKYYFGKPYYDIIDEDEIFETKEDLLKHLEDYYTKSKDNNIK